MLRDRAKDNFVTQILSYSPLACLLDLGVTTAEKVASGVKQLLNIQESN